MKNTIVKKIQLCLQNKQNCNILISGKVGVGKTHLAKQLISELINIKKEKIISPTFNLLNQYSHNNIHIAHYDLYRVNKQINDLNLLENLLDKNMIVIIEWADRIYSQISHIEHILLEIDAFHNIKIK